VRRVAVVEAIGEGEVEQAVAEVERLVLDPEGDVELRGGPAGAIGGVDGDAVLVAGEAGGVDGDDAGGAHRRRVGGGAVEGDGERGGGDGGGGVGVDVVDLGVGGAVG